MIVYDPYLILQVVIYILQEIYNFIFISVFYELQVWKYQGTNQLGDGALERIHMDVQTGEGLTDTDFVLAGGADGSLR